MMTDLAIIDVDNWNWLVSLIFMNTSLDTWPSLIFNFEEDLIDGRLGSIIIINVIKMFLLWEIVNKQN